MNYSRFLLTLLIILPALSGQAASLSPKQQLSIAPELAARIDTDPIDTEYNVIVRLASPNASAIRLSNLAASAGTLHDRYQHVGGALRSASASAIPALTGKSKVVRRFWIANVAEMQLDRAALLELAEHDDVVMVAPNVGIELLDPVSVTDAVSAGTAAAANLQTIGARSLWARGLTGRGRVVASIDTGVEGVHPALTDRWRGRNGDTAASWFDPLNAPSPSDNNGHGTHVMGIMVGRHGSDTIGLAPDAEWISAAVVDRGRSLSATFADILAAMQWVVDPDGNPHTMDDVPDVVCNSWGVSQEIINACDQLFFEAIDNVEAMGVVCVFAAGNEGPTPKSIRNPADRAGAPNGTFSVGAVDANYSDFPVPSFSSRGPSACNNTAKKPEIAAPGVGIRSAFKGQTYKIINGTSMAAPHVAAAVALLRQYNPELTPEQIKTALLSTAHDIGAPGEDNASGHGLIDLEAALATVTSATYPSVTTGPIYLNAGLDGVAGLGEEIELIVPVTGSVVEVHNATLNLKAISPRASVLAGSAYLGTIPVNQTVTNGSSPFLVRISDNLRAGDTAWFETSISGVTLLNWWRDTVAIMVGLPQGATIATSKMGAASLSLSNFGHLGLADGTSMNAGGEGWRTAMIGANILYEGALMASSADGGWSDVSRREDGSRRFDFTPQIAANGALCFDDSHSEFPVGISIDQRVLPILGNENYEATTIVWTLRNSRSTAIPGAQLAWLIDIDLPGVGIIDERVSLDPTSGGYFHIAPAASFVAGIAPLSGSLGSLHFYENFGSKQTLSNAEKRESLKGWDAAPVDAGDYGAIASTNPVDLEPGDSVVIALAFISGRSSGDFAEAASESRSRWLSMSGVDDDQGGTPLPADFTLDQNYPNPFNAATIIPLQIAGDGSRQVRLEIHNLLGQRVRTLLDERAEAGHRNVLWDGRDDDGRAVASGVYFARLTVAGGTQQVRSMVLLK